MNRRRKCHQAIPSIYARHRKTMGELVSICVWWISRESSMRPRDGIKELLIFTSLWCRRVPAAHERIVFFFFTINKRSWNIWGQKTSLNFGADYYYFILFLDRITTGSFKKKKATILNILFFSDDVIMCQYSWISQTAFPVLTLYITRAVHIREPLTK